MRSRFACVGMFLAVLLASASCFCAQVSLYGWRMARTTEFNAETTVFTPTDFRFIPNDNTPLSINWTADKQGMRVASWFTGTNKLGRLDYDSLVVLATRTNSLDLSSGSAAYSQVAAKIAEWNIQSALILVEFDYVSYALTVDDVHWANQIYTNRVVLTSPTKTGYAHTGWLDVRGTGFSAGVPYTGSDFGVATHDDKSKVELTSQWAPNSYNLSYDFGGGEGVGSYPSQLKYDVQATLANPTRLGYRFKGWNLTGADLATKELSQGADSATIKNLNPTNGANVKLTAVWENETYTVSFNNKGGSGGATSLSMVYDQSYDAKFVNCPTRTGGIFKGYWIGEKQYWNDNGEPAQPKWDIASNVVAVAQWLDTTYYVTYDPNGGSGRIDPQPFTYGQMITLSDGQGFSRNGCRLLGWARNRDAITPDPNFPLGGATQLSADVTLFAIWEISYYLGFEGNGATTGTMAVQQLIKGEPATLHSNAFARTGYAFGGWATNALDARALKVAYADGAPIQLDGNEPGSTNWLWAVWRTNTYYVAFDRQEGKGGPMAMLTNKYDQVVTLPPNAFAPPDELHVFKGWRDELNGMTYADGEEVSNLCATAFGTNTLKAVWGLDVGEWSDAMHCTNLRWSVIREDTGDAPSLAIYTGPDFGYRGSGSCVGQNNKVAIFANKKWLTAQVTTNGTLSFKCKWNREPTSTGEGVYPPGVYYGVTVTDASVFWDFTPLSITACGDEWQDVTIPVSLTDDQDFVNVYLVAAFASDGDVLYIDQMTWTPDGGSVEPGPEDAPTVTGVSFKDGKIVITSSSDVKFDYRVVTSPSLAEPITWTPVEASLTPGADGTVPFELPVDPAEPQKFYKVEVLKKR